jgi:hypothetical protein
MIANIALSPDAAAGFFTQLSGRARHFHLPTGAIDTAAHETRAIAAGCSIIANRFQAGAGNGVTQARRCALLNAEPCIPFAAL